MESQNLSNICPICVNPIKDDNYTISECNHSFHLECIIKWWRSPRFDGCTGTCPLCRSGPSQICVRAETIEKGRFVRKLSRKKNTPTVVKNLVKKIKEYEKKQKIHNRKTNAFYRSKQYKNFSRKMRNFDNKRWHYRTKIRDIYAQLASHYPYNYYILRDNN